jgi:hypothetical protein
LALYVAAISQGKQNQWGSAKSDTLRFMINLPTASSIS